LAARLVKEATDADFGTRSQFHARLGGDTPTALREAAMLEVTGGLRRIDLGPTEPLFFTPFVSSPMRVDPAWIDYNGHLNTAYYGVLFDRAVDEAFLACGMGPDYVRDRGMSYFLVENRIRHLREIGRRDRVRMTLQLLDVDDKRMRYVLEMRETKDGWIAATSEQLALHVDMRTRKTTPFPDDIRAALESMKAAHSAKPAPDWAGLGVTMPPSARKH
jgi:acyl-CoA thioester hydrolase